MQQDPNPGGEQGQASPGLTGGQAMTPQEEQTWSILAHVSVLVMPFGALVIWLLFKDRSQKVGFHALQALWYQIAWIVILTAYSLISTVLMLVIVGFFMFILLPFLVLVPIIHGCYAAYQVSQGVDYRYPYIADRIDESHRVA